MSYWGARFNGTENTLKEFEATPYEFNNAVFSALGARCNETENALKELEAKSCPQEFSSTLDEAIAILLMDVEGWPGF